MTPSTPTTSSASSPRSPLPPAPQRSLKAGFVHRQFGIWPKPSLSLVRRGGEEDEEELLPRSTLPLPPDTVGCMQDVKGSFKSFPKHETRHVSDHKPTNDLDFHRENPILMSAAKENTVKYG
ncbi:hypothetical protein ABZP36_005506 [Zizania latifolia]